MKAHQLTLTAAAIGLALSTSAIANDEKDQIEVIEVKGGYLKGYNAHSASGASRMELDIKDIPQSVSVITDAQMQDYQLTDIDAVLDTATGVNVERVETDRTYYTARGFDITNFQVDGVGLPLTSGNNHADEDTVIYDRIEVIRGANGLMTGVGNPSATINFIRKRPEAQNALSVNATLGSWSKKRLELDGTFHISQDTAVRGVFARQESDSYLDRYSPDKNIFYVFLQHQLSDQTSVSISHAINDSKAKGNNWGANPLFYTDGSATDYDVSTNTSANWSMWDVKKQNTVFEIVHNFEDGWQLRGTYSRKTTDEDTELFYVYGTPDRQTELGLNGWASEYDNDDEHDLYDVYMTGQFDLFGRTHDLVFGANSSSMEGKELSLYDYTTGNGFPVLPGLPQWTGNTPRPTFNDAETGSDTERNQKALYFTARFSVSDDLHITTGGRRNDWEVKGISYGNVVDASDDKFIPYLGAVYQLTDSTTAYVGYTETFVSQTNRDRNGDVLDAITGESQEVGIKSSWFDDKLLATFTYFETVQNNVAVGDDAASTPGDQRFIAVKGIETDGYEAEFVGEPVEGLQTSFGYTRFDIKGRDDLAKTVSDYTPKTLIKFAATYDMPQLDGLTVGMNMRWQDDISRIQGVVGEGFANAGQTIITEQKAYSVVDLMVRYEISENLSVTLNANNVFDKKYLNSLYWAQGYYAAPANYSATLSWSL